jgi:hypothetical protein
VPERLAGVHGVDGASAGARPGQVARGLQVGDDGLRGALGDVGGGGDVPDPGGGVARDLHEHVPVRGQQRPPAAVFLAIVHNLNIISRASDHEKIFGRKLA